MTAEFVFSIAEINKLPNGIIPEFAFIGRSNVGKSSLINMLTGRKSLARSSVVPGKTQLINFFLVDKKWYIVDLPGLGYAKLGKEKCKILERLVYDYIQHPHQFSFIFLLIDMRHPLLEIDLKIINHLKDNNVHFAIIFTKTDKLKQNEISKNLNLYKTYLNKQFIDLPFAFISSATTKKGRDEILNFINSIMNNKS
ncbi:MAG: YihA family ribosome biogenesis GTP-binding protein [Bacteroidales bacterium]|nr:YihA family ribosome biogenesis GTP-binding protein [Bacteroidales bacterium]